MNSKTKNLTLYTILTAIAGLLLSLYSVYHRESLLVNGTQGSFCSISSTIDCDSVALSSFSSFLGISVAGWATGFYGIFLVLAFSALFALQDSKLNKFYVNTHLQKLLGVLGLVPTLFLAGVSAVYLKTLCLLCLGNYVVNFLLFIFTQKAAKEFSKQEPKFSVPVFSGISKSVWVFASLFFVGGLAVPSIIRSGLTGGAFNSDLLNSLMASHLNQKAHYFSTDDMPFLGSPDAKITVVEFADYQCPTCKLSAKTLPKLIQSYGGKVRYVFKNYPLDNTCNPEINRPFHRQACLAAKSSWCVFKKFGNDTFFKVKSELFRMQEGLKTDDSVISIVLENSEYTKDDLMNCVGDPATHQAILNQISEGKNAEVKGTPSIYINGRALPSGPSPIPFNHAISVYFKNLI